MLKSADTYFENEIGIFDAYLPDDKALAAIAAPVKVLVSDESEAYFDQAAGRLAERLGVGVDSTPGTHFPYLDHPEQLAGTVKAFLARADA